MDKTLISTYLNGRRTPLSQLAGGSELHAALYAAAPAFCLRLIGDPDADISHRAEMLANLVRHGGRTGIGCHAVVHRLRSVSAEALLHLLDGLRRRRLNGGRVRRIVLPLLLGHPELPELAASHRQRLIRLLRHVLGERTWASVCRAVWNPTPAGTRRLNRTLLRYASDRDMAQEVLGFLAEIGLRTQPAATPKRQPWLVVPWLSSVPKQKTAGEFRPRSPILVRSLAARRDITQGEGLPRETLTGLRGTYHPQVPMQHVRLLSAINGRSRTDGPLTSLYKQALTDNYSSEELRLHLATADRSGQMIAARVAVVLDLSASSRSSGERSYHPAALGLSVTRLLRQSVERLSIHQVGGLGNVLAESFTAPDGGTDLATAVLDAARHEPDVILIVTDGYENTRQGDTARVVRGLEQLGTAPVVYQLLTLFMAAEDVHRRRLGENIPLVPVTHERGIREVLAHVLLATLPETIGLEQLEQLGRVLRGNGREL